MNIITIPKELIKEGELVLIPRKQLEELIKMSKKTSEEIELTSLQKKALSLARSNKKLGKFLNFDELKNKLGIAN